MKHLLIIIIIFFVANLQVKAQQFPKLDTRNYVSDSIVFHKKNPWLAAGEVFGVNMGVWAVDRYIANADFARINFSTIKNNFKKGFVWDTDMFSTNLFAHPYHGSLYFNAARSNGMNFWQSIPYTVGGSLMWEFFMENEHPSINDLMSTSFGGTALGEITYRLSDLFIDNRSTGTERIGREILSTLISPVRGINRLITGEAWRHTPGSKGRSFRKVPVNFIVNAGPRFLAVQEKSKHGSVGMNILFRLDYGDPFSDPTYSPYEWFQVRAGLELFSSQPLINQFNTIGALWGKPIFEKDQRTLTFGIFQHFDYYDSKKIPGSENEVVPYRISEAIAIGPGFLFNRRATPGNKVDVYGEFFLNGVGLGASVSDYYKVGERDYNMGSGYSIKMFAGLTYNQRWNFLINAENYHIFTWVGYDPDIDWNSIENPEELSVQGDNSNARLTVFSTNLIYISPKKWNIKLSNRYFHRRTHYKYYDNVEFSTYDITLSLGIKI